MSGQKFTERLMPIRLDRPLQDELTRIAQELRLSKSQVVRASIHLSIEKPSEIERIMEKMKAESDAWYKKHKHNGEKK